MAAAVAALSSADSRSKAHGPGSPLRSRRMDARPPERAGRAVLLPGLAALQRQLMERSPGPPNEVVVDDVPRFVSDLEDAIDVLSGKIVCHGCQPVILIECRLFSL